jgi:starch synthase
MALQALFASPEIPPWVKSGGLGDVTAALPRALRAIGIDCRVLVPGYPAVLAASGDASASVAEFAAPGGAYPAARVLAAGEVNGAPLYAIDCPALFDRAGGAYHDPRGTDWPDNALRFGLLSKVAALVAQSGLRDGFRPSVLHCNDWPTGLAPAYVKWAGLAGVGSLVTVHNVAYQGIFAPSILGPLDVPPAAFHINGVEYFGNVSFLKAALFYADRINAVSPRYAFEIRTPAGGYSMDGLLRVRGADVSGILNGIDVDAWDPRRDALIAARYDAASLAAKRLNKRALQERLGLAPRAEHMLLGVVSRLTYQKGLDTLVEIGDRIAALGLQLALLGTGEAAQEDAFRALAVRHPGRIAVTIGFDERLAHLIEAGADAFVMPSRFEPCGLNQMYSLRYGTPPIVRATGGLYDTVTDCTPATLAAGTANGFAFAPPTGAALFEAIERALLAWRDPAVWAALQRNGMSQDFTWEASARRYGELYEAALGAR